MDGHVKELLAIGGCPVRFRFASGRSSSLSFLFSPLCVPIKLLVVLTHHSPRWRWRCLSLSLSLSLSLCCFPFFSPSSSLSKEINTTQASKQDDSRPHLLPEVFIGGGRPPHTAERREPSRGPGGEERGESKNKVKSGEKA